MTGIGGALVAIIGFVVLFTVFGMWVRHSGCGGACDSCTPDSCERNDEPPIALFEVE